MKALAGTQIHPAPVEEESTYSYSETRPDSPVKLPREPALVQSSRRLSLVDSSRPEILDIDPRAVHPGLNLTGGLISATFCIPHAVEFRSGADWVRSSEPYVGMADLLGSQIETWYLGALRFLLPPLPSPQTPWNHTLVG
jgi:trehalose 6-phosphate synthase/phosphatase